MKRVIGLAHLTMLDVAPPELVSVAAAAGFGSVGLRVAPVTRAEVHWPMSAGSPMLAETAGRCADTGVGVHAVEAITLGPGSGTGSGQSSTMTTSPSPVRTAAFISPPFPGSAARARSDDGSMHELVR